MRIAYLHQYYVRPSFGGASRSWQFARRWVAAGHEVHIVTTDWRNQHDLTDKWLTTDEDGITVHYASVPYDNSLGFAGRMRAFISFASRAAARVRSVQPDVVYATSTPLTIALPAMAATCCSDTPFVFEVRDLWPDVPIAMGYLSDPITRNSAKLLERTTYRRASHIITTAPGMREDIIAKGVSASKISVVPHGCDNDIFADADPGAIDMEFPWVNDGPVVFYAGTLGQANSLGYLLDVAEQMLDLNSTVRFVVAGDGKQGPALIADAQERGLLNRSVFFLGHLDTYEVARWLKRSSISMVLLQGPRVMWKDAGQNKFFDAVAAGTPVAVNNDSWQSQVALDHGIGVHLDPTNTLVAARQLNDALTNEQWLAGVPERCRTLADGEFARDNLAQKALAIVEAARCRGST